MNADTILASLRRAVEATDIDADGAEWGTVYLNNVGRGHSFAGFLSALTARGEYKPTSDDHFGQVKMAAPAPKSEPTIQEKIREMNAEVKRRYAARWVRYAPLTRSAR